MIEIKLGEMSEVSSLMIAQDYRALIEED
ncbi:MAG: hypothetical protein ACRDRA_20365 [Pseudonocardiaceae bacterium]